MESLQPGDTLRIFWRATPYREKIMIAGQGTALHPIKVCGVPGPLGELPVIDGENATTRAQLSFPFDGHQPRGLVIIGHANNNPNYLQNPRHIILEGLEIRGADPSHTFTSRTGVVTSYVQFSAGIFIERGENVTIRGCDLHDNNLGIYGGTGGGDVIMSGLLIEKNHIHANGSLQSYYEHNIYTEGLDTVMQFNRMGSPRGPDGYAMGSNIKDRGAGTVIRYNWIEDGAHLIDLVDAQEAQDTTVALPSFHTTWVYGNVLLRIEPRSGSMIHYGGDSGVLPTYRKGTLQFASNTLYVKNSTYTDYQTVEVFELTTEDESLAARNNIFAAEVAPTAVRPVYLVGSRDGITPGTATLSNNWFRQGWIAHPPASEYNTVTLQHTGFTTATFGTAPGFVNVAADDYHLTPGSVARNAGLAIPGLALDWQYVKHQSAQTRAPAGALDLGAFED